MSAAPESADRAARLADFLAAARHRRLVMGILNVTPDSFSDGGRYPTVEAAVAQALAMEAAGAAVVDVGGESTRPGFTPVPLEEEWRRVAPALEALAPRLGVPISIDTTKPDVARRAVRVGATVVNDIWGLQGDPGMAEAVAESGAALVAMHNRAEKDETIDIVDDMRRFFERTLARAERTGIARDRIILDPGIGFGKTRRQQFEAIAGVGALSCFGLPLLIGVSRKSFIGAVGGAAIQDRLPGTIAANLAAAAAGVTLFRVHDVAEHVAALAVADAIRAAA